VTVLALFATCVLPFDLSVSKVYAELMVQAKQQGKAIGKEDDGYIAATASMYGFAEASRDESPFRAAKVPIINPWKS